MSFGRIRADSNDTITDGSRGRSQKAIFALLLKFINPELLNPRHPQIWEFPCAYEVGLGARAYPLVSNSNRC